MAHAESLSNAIAGLVIAQIVLWLWGLPAHEAVGLNAVMFGASYARSLLLRWVFGNTTDKHTRDET